MCSVNISSRCEYGCRAVVELAQQAAAAQPVTVEHIAERRHIPEKFLIHILLQLKRAGIVRSIRGARGGYLLARAPEDISLLDIVRAVDTLHEYGIKVHGMFVLGADTDDRQTASDTAASVRSCPPSSPSWRGRGRQ